MLTMALSDPIWTPYCGVAPSGGDWRWNPDPVLLIVLAMAAVLVACRSVGVRRVWGLAGVGVLAVGFISPLCAMSSALFAARTVHHLLLMVVAAPMLAAWLPGRRYGALGLAVALQALVLWGWHVPAAYEAALSSDGIYWTMQLSLLASATWFWAAVRSASAPAALGALLAAMVAMGLLGAILTFASQPFYAPHFATTLGWGLTPLEDQQIAGLLMWAPASAAYLFAALWRLARLLAPAPAARPA